MSTTEYVTLMIGDQLFGAAVTEIHDVFAPTSITPVPLAPREIAGVLNLRGRIVTAIDTRARLGLPPRETGLTGAMAIGVERSNESFGLIIDSVGEVLRLNDDEREDNPVNLQSAWAEISKGVYRLDGRLLVILDLDRIMTFATDRSAVAA